MDSGKTGIRIPTHDAESFIRGSAVAGLLRIVRVITMRTAQRSARAALDAARPAVARLDSSRGS